MLQISLLFS